MVLEMAARYQLSPPKYLDEAVNRIVQQFNPLRVILFGSWAQGDAHPDSDIDLLVVLPQVDNKRQAAIRIGDALSDLPVSKDIVVTTPEEIAVRSHIVRSILQPAVKEGKVLYEHSRRSITTCQSDPSNDHRRHQGARSTTL